jgi:hypothetical protein
VLLLGDEDQVEARLISFGDSANLDTRQVHGLCRAFHRPRKSCWTHPMDLLGEWVMWNLVSVHLEIVLVSVEYWCSVCAKDTLGSEIVLCAPEGTRR